MNAPDAVLAAAEALAQAIARRDQATIASLLARGFTHREHGGAASEPDAFLKGIASIPGEIRFVRLEDTRVDVTPTGALVTGSQHAQVVVDGNVIDDRRRYVDWFVEIDGAWKVQAAVDWSY